MSYARQVRSELAQIYVKKNCCAASLLWGMLRFAGVFGQEEIRLTTRSDAVAQLLVGLLERVCGIAGTLSVRAGKDADSSSFRVTLRGEEAARLLSFFAYQEGDGLGVSAHILQCDKCASAFVRGAFLACGNISDPTSSYHLDLTVGDEGLSRALSAFLGEQGLPVPRMTVRKQLPVLYYKGSTDIEDFLAYIGATKSVFSMMDTKIFKEIRNDTNRRQNFDLANLSRAIRGAQTHITAIRILQDCGKYALLPPELKQTSQLRLAHPEMSLADLAAAHMPPLTKSGLNHRLHRLEELARQAEEESLGGKKENG